jgi:hypothetical protein
MTYYIHVEEFMKLRALEEKKANLPTLKEKDKIERIEKSIKIIN